MAEFKVGDRVRCVMAGDEHLKEGDVVVVRALGSFGFINISTQSGVPINGNWQWSTDRFRPHEHAGTDDHADNAAYYEAITNG